MGSFVLPGMQVTASRYHDSMVLFSHTNRVETVVDGAPPGPRGRLFVIEPGKPQRVPYEAGRYILEHLSYTGVVRVREEETDEGIKYDVQGALQESLKLTEEMDKKRFETYVSDCVEDFVKRNKPVPQPPASILEIIKRRGYDLRQYGIVPIGWKEPEKDGRIAQLEAMVAALGKQLAEMTPKGKHKAE